MDNSISQDFSNFIENETEPAKEQPKPETEVDPLFKVIVSEHPNSY